MAALVETKVIVEGRTWPKKFPDLVWGFVYLCALGFQIIVMLYLIFTSNVSGDQEPSQQVCTGQYAATVYNVRKMSSGLIEDLCECRTRNNQQGVVPSSRRLNSNNQEEYTMYDFLSKKPFVPVIMAFLTLFLSFLYIALLRFYAKQIVFLTLAIQIACGYGVGFLFIDWGIKDHGIIVIGIVTLFLAYVIVRRQKFINAGNFMTEAVKGIIKHKSIFCVILPLQIFILVILLLLCLTWMSVFSKYKVNEGSCGLVIDLSGMKFAQYCSLLTVWTVFFVKHVKVHIVAMTIASWCFGQEGPEVEKIEMKAFWLGLTKSAPVLACSSFIIAMTETLRRRAQNKLNWLNPACFFVNIVACVVTEMVKAFGRFAVIYHSIVGTDFCASAKLSFAMLKKHLESVLVADFVGRKVVNLANYVFALVVGFTVWAWFDDIMGFDPPTLSPSGMGGETIFIIFIVLYLIMNFYPMVTLFILNYVGEYIKGKFAGFITALFVSTIAHLIFEFVSDIILYAIDTVYVCYAIQKEAGKVIDKANAETGKIYFLLEAPKEQGGVIERLPVGAVITPGAPGVSGIPQANIPIVQAQQMPLNMVQQKV